MSSSMSQSLPNGFRFVSSLQPRIRLQSSARILVISTLAQFAVMEEVLDASVCLLGQDSDRSSACRRRAIKTTKRLAYLPAPRRVQILWTHINCSPPSNTEYLILRMIVTSARTHDPNSSAPAGETDSRVAVALVIALLVYLILCTVFIVIKKCISPFRLSLRFVDRSVLLSLWTSHAHQIHRSLRISLQPRRQLGSGSQAAQEPSSAPEEPPTPTVPPHGEDHPSPPSPPSDSPNVMAIHAHNSSQRSLAESFSSTITTMSRWSASAVTLVKKVLPRLPGS
ncbi:hypothetical protein MVEN_02446600 [Mycena venus]|uniref:Uncharacterized protein n=1 Tax=Mycena venus TaxID=2733690 RepID=A0A8H7CD09_9AGAR|nr:hypothetical protein MVEN_02446600 [Mycena venus]